MGTEPHIVILGAGFGGLAAATELNHLAGEGKVRVTLVERNRHFSMGFSMQWTLVGRRPLEAGLRSFDNLAARHVAFLHDEVVGIDTAARAVFTRSRRLDYDALLVATGAELAPEVIPGLSEGAFNLCDGPSVLQLRAAVETLKRGTLLIAVTTVPFKCPPAPYEYALLLDDVLRQRGVRDDVRVVMTTPEPQPMPVAGKAVGDAVKALLADRGIEYFPARKITGVDARRRVVSYEGSPQIAYDLFAAMPPHRAPKVVREAGLADASGFVPVDLRTMRTAVDGVYAVGDVAALKLPGGSPHPKAGVFAEAQGLTAARTIAVQLLGGEAPTYAGSGTCFVDTGREEAAPAEIHLLAEGGPRAVLGPPSAAGLAGKREFERERLARWFGR